MSTFLRFILVLFSISLLISMGVFLLAGQQLYQLIFLDERDDQSFWVLDFRSQVQGEVGEQITNSLARARQTLELEGGDLQSDMQLDFVVNKNVGDYSGRLMLYEFTNHYSYLYAITNPDFDNEISGTNFTFGGYGHLKEESGSFVLVCMIKTKNEYQETNIALENLKKAFADQMIHMNLELKDPIVWGLSDWKHVWLLNFEDRESAIRLLDSYVFQSELLIASSVVEDLAISVYR